MRLSLVCLLALFGWHAAAHAQPQQDEEPAPPEEAKPANPAPPSPVVRPDDLVVEPAPPTTPRVDIGKIVVRPVDAPTGLQFGSYGRIIAGTDMRGGKPESANIVAHGPRIVEPSYLELDFSYAFLTKSGKRLRTVTTLAFDGTLFHDTGDFDARPALRNMFLDAQLTDNLSGWVGSRMYRGDDIYLLDYWPLDDLNTVGGGLFHRTKINATNALELQAHAGVNRLLRDFQFQQIDVANPRQGATTVVQLNRQRLVASAGATYLIDNGPADPSFKVKLYGELHALGSGTRKRVDGTFEDLPSDSGYLVGVQLGTYGWAPKRFGFRRHINAFARYAQGLAAFDELAPPTSFGADLRTNRASELSFGLSSNWDHKLGNILIGALSRRFVDADVSTVDFDDGWEYALSARPLAHVAGDVYAGFDISYQARFPRGINPNTERAEDPAVFQFAPMLVYSPMGPSGYDRPQIRVVYRIASLNEAARDLFVPGDPRHAEHTTYFLGVQAEWWINSANYRR
ncbi:MAG: carbohydrate porin [Deltaproteobacteria bacterium]|nr:carbohydrate porin [Deltaproteobacteria bacterium]